MKKIISYILTFILLATCSAQASLAEKTPLKTQQQIVSMQTRTYYVKDPQTVMDSVDKLISMYGYKVQYQTKEYYYVKATKYESIKDICLPLIAVYTVKTGIDTCLAVLTYGVKSYSVVGDILLIKTELKDKTLETVMGVNVIPEGNMTKVRVNIQTLMNGKRDGRFFGKQSRLKTIEVVDELQYKTFFFRLNQILQEQNIKRANF